MIQKDLKELVKEKYGEIARTSDNQQAGSCGCGTSCCTTFDYTTFSESYSHLEGYNPDADLGLGCGIPTEYAAIKPGDHVLDLGSGAGNDCFVARAITGETGHVTGIDFTESMLLKAEENRLKLGFANIDFVKGDIEEMPFPDNRFDVVLSNCVLNLVPDKMKAFKEVNRVLKPGAHFCVSDVVLKGNLPDNLRNDAEMYAGCVSGAIQLEDYLNIIKEACLINVRVLKEKEIVLPENVMLKYFDKKGLDEFRNSGSGIFSVTVYGEKPALCSCGGNC